MDAVVGLVAFVVTLVAFVAAGGYAAYLAMLSSAARKRPGGQPAVEFARKRFPVAGVSLGVTVLAMLIASGANIGGDIFAMLLAGGGGAASMKALQNTQSRFRNGQY